MRGNKTTVHLMAKCEHRDSKRAREPKVGKLQDITVAVLVAHPCALSDEQILRLEITVQNAVRVTEAQARH